MISPDTLISSLPRVAPAYQKRLFKLGLKTVRDLLFHFPRRYDDFSKITRIRDLRAGAVYTIQGRVIDIKNSRSWKKRLSITEAFIQDESGSIRAIWFNQPYLTNVLKIDTIINLSGKVNLDKDLYFSNPAYERIANSEGQIAENQKTTDYKPLATSQTRHTGRLVPVYPETAGLSSRYLRYLIQPHLASARELVDWLPDSVKRSQRLINLADAIYQVHFPDSLKNANSARQRLAFEEIFLIQLFALTQKLRRIKEQAWSIEFNKDLIRGFLEKLPFKLTTAQKKAAWEIFLDMAKDQPMNRLLEGDVGSGKTVVAALAALEAAQAGYQTAFMAPTEILAGQHFKTLTGLLSDYPLNVCLLTGTGGKEFRNGRFFDSGKKLLLAKIENGEEQIIVGTHALIQKQVNFKKLALAVVDEQHRFGVKQRAALQKNINRLPDGSVQKIPHLLSMTATPIPRSLALTIYGDLDLSLIDEMPRDRQTIITRLVPPLKRAAAYDFIRRQVAGGRQVFVVCPRIEPAEENAEQLLPPQNEIKAVKAEHEKLSRKIFPELKVALLHGKLKPPEKEQVMADFAAGRTDILVATSVIEVGIDIPNAAIMMIEGADRFGLAQLHQLRGRVGRGRHQSYCLLFTDSGSAQTQNRLKIMTACASGFKLAEYDLQWRGPGQFFGTNQSGLPDLPLASLIDLILIKQARREAAKILQADPELKNYPLLKEKLKKFRDEIHLE